MLIVGTDVPYAASGGTTNTALTPDLLDAGAIGIYTVDKTTGLFKLVTKTAAGTGLLPAASVTSNDTLKIVQGLGGGSFYQSDKHDVNGIQSITGSVYAAGSGQAIYIGYNPTLGTGDINFDPQVTPPQPPYTTLSNLYHREVAIKLRKRLRGNNEYDAAVYFEVPLLLTDTRLTMLNNIVANANTYQDEGIAGFPFVATVTGNFLAAPVQIAITAALSGGTIPDATYYAKIVYFGTNGNSLGSNEQSVVAASTVANQSTLTFNWGVPPIGTTSSRVYLSTVSGAYASYYNVASGTTHTLTITALGAPVAGTIPTSTALGVKIVPSDITATYEASVFGGLENATIGYVGVSLGSGTPKQLQAIELDSNIYRGDLYTMSTIEKKLQKTVDTTKTYDVYRIQSINSTSDKTGSRASSDTRITTTAAFVVQANVVGTNQQADFEDILTIIFPATAQIS